MAIRYSGLYTYSLLELYYPGIQFKCIYNIFVAERHLDSCNIICVSFLTASFFVQIIRHSNDIATAWMSFCSKYICKHNMFSTCDFSDLFTYESYTHNFYIWLTEIAVFYCFPFDWLTVLVKSWKMTQLPEIVNYLSWITFCKKKQKDIQMILQLSKCLSATNICEENMFPTCDFMFIQHNSHSDKVSLYI